MAQRGLLDETHCSYDAKQIGRTIFYGEDKSMNVYGRNDPMERRMGFK